MHEVWGSNGGVEDMNSMHEKCFTCRYWNDPYRPYPPGVEPLSWHRGECKRHAPVAVITRTYGVFPVTLGTHSCGDWERAK